MTSFRCRYFYTSQVEPVNFSISRLFLGLQVRNLKQWSVETKVEQLVLNHHKLRASYNHKIGEHEMMLTSFTIKTKLMHSYNTCTNGWAVKSFSSIQSDKRVAQTSYSMRWRLGVNTITKELLVFPFGMIGFDLWFTAN